MCGVGHVVNEVALLSHDVVLCVQDWVQYEEMGDLEEKSRSHFFETMLASVQQQLQHSYNMATVVQPSSCPAAEGDDVSISVTWLRQRVVMPLASLE